MARKPKSVAPVEQVAVIMTVTAPTVWLDGKKNIKGEEIIVDASMAERLKKNGQAK